MSMSFSERTAQLKKVLRALRTKYGKQQLDASDSVARQLLKIVLIEETPEPVVDQALKRIAETFVDLNELRVSLAREITDTLVGVARAHDKAVQVTKLFNEIFLRHNSMEWDFVRTMGVRELRQYFETVNGGSPELGAAAVMFFSSGHAVPADADVRRVLGRLEITESQEDVPTIQAFLERAVTKEQGYETWALLHRVAEAVCAVKAPQCAKCPLKALCPMGQARIKAGKGRTAAATKKTARKPRASKKKTATRRPAGKPARSRKGGRKK